jgi:hypothetical protein
MKRGKVGILKKKWHNGREEEGREESKSMGWAYSVMRWSFAAGLRSRRRRSVCVSAGRPGFSYTKRISAPWPSCEHNCHERVRGLVNRTFCYDRIK